jgi:hypothetical protein
MAEVHFTAWLRKLAPDGPVQAGGGTVCGRAACSG